METLPPELTHPALALVGVVGLKDNNHVDEALTKNIFRKQSRQVPIQFIQLPSTFSLPPKKVKPKEKEKDPGTIQGIIKSNWVSKHFSRNPAVILSFHHFDPFEPDWKNHDGNMINDLLEKK